MKVHQHVVIAAFVVLLTAVAVALARLAPGIDVARVIEVIVIGALALAGGVKPGDR